MTVAWVLGSSGLLGAALCRELRRDGSELFFPPERFHWNNGAELFRQMAAAVRSLSVRLRTDDPWEIYWAAGVGTMGSQEGAMASETHALSSLVQLLESDPHLMATSGAIAFASSAGAIYAGSSDDIITENTSPAPTTAYALEKLRQEDVLRDFSTANHRVNTLLARISTLYGPGQASGKQQGLLAHMARSILRNQPVQIYVPYDTIRDYITADDAAGAMVAALRATRNRPRILTKIIASEQPATIAEIVSIFKRVTRRAPRVVTSASKLSSLYSRRVQFRSIVTLDGTAQAKNSLLVGIAQLMTAERALIARGRAQLTTAHG